MKRADQFQEFENATLYISPSETISQNITAGKNNFCAVSLILYNPNLGQKGEYILRILDQKGGEVRRDIISESNMGWGDTILYSFEPVSDSGGKEYKFEFADLQLANPEETKYVYLLNKEETGEKVEYENPGTAVNYKNSTLKMSYFRNENYPAGSAFINNSKIRGDIKFTTYYCATAKEFIHDSLKDFGGRLVQDRLFLVSYFFIFVFLVSMLIVRVYKVDLQK